VKRITLIIHLKSRDAIIDSVICENDEEVTVTRENVNAIIESFQCGKECVCSFGHTIFKLSEVTALRTYEKEIESRGN
jgi:hypothetical protein